MKRLFRRQHPSRRAKLKTHTEHDRYISGVVKSLEHEEGEYKRPFGAAAGLFASLAIIMLLSSCGKGPLWGEERAPMQPYPFSHKLHSGENKIGCQTCHITARWKAVAGLPNAEICLRCHNIIQRDLPIFDEMRKNVAAGNSVIVWERVNRTSGLAKYSHRIHEARGYTCEECHPGVKDTEAMAPGQKWSMYFCARCHSKNMAPMRCSACHDFDLKKTVLINKEEDDYLARKARKYSIIVEGRFRSSTKNAFSAIDGKRFYLNLCIHCHGDLDVPNRPVGMQLNPPPPHFFDRAKPWKTNPVTRAEKVMDGFGLMPPFGNYLTYDELTAIFSYMDYNYADTQPKYIEEHKVIYAPPEWRKWEQEQKEKEEKGGGE